MRLKLPAPQTHVNDNRVKAAERAPQYGLRPAYKCLLMHAPPALAVGRASTYGQFLDPLGLTDTYCEAFHASRIPFQVRADLVVLYFNLAGRPSGFATMCAEMLKKSAHSI